MRPIPPAAATSGALLAALEIIEANHEAGLRVVREQISAIRQERAVAALAVWPPTHVDDEPPSLSYSDLSKGLRTSKEGAKKWVARVGKKLAVEGRQIDKFKKHGLTRVTVASIAEHLPPSMRHMAPSAPGVKGAG